MFGAKKEALSLSHMAAWLWSAIGVDDLVMNILPPRIEEAKKHLTE
jgi:hypothetical protein